jgi:hypothetical protein
VIVGPSVYSTGLTLVSTSSGAPPSIGKRHSRCVPSASTRITEMCAPSGVTVGEYSLSAVVVTRSVEPEATS